MKALMSESRVNCSGVVGLPHEQVTFGDFLMHMNRTLGGPDAVAPRYIFDSGNILTGTELGADFEHPEILNVYRTTTNDQFMAGTSALI